MSVRNTRGPFILTNAAGDATVKVAMPSTYTDLLAAARKRIREISLEDLRRRLEAKDGLVVVDVREKEE